MVKKSLLSVISIITFSFIFNGCSSRKQELKFQMHITNDKLTLRVINPSKDYFWICTSSINNQSPFTLIIYDLDSNILNHSNRLMRINYHYLFKDGTYSVILSKDSADIGLNIIDPQISIKELEEPFYYIKLIYNTSYIGIEEHEKLEKFLKSKHIARFDYESNLIRVSKNELIKIIQN